MAGVHFDTVAKTWLIQSCILSHPGECKCRNNRKKVALVS